MVKCVIQIAGSSKADRTKHYTSGDPNRHKTKVQKSAIYSDKTQHANFWGNPLHQATKLQLNGEQEDVEQNDT